MRISVFGCGYLGTVHAACLAAAGHDVVGLDVEPGRVAQLARGEVPFFEPGLAPLVESGLASGRLRFDTDPRAAAGARVHFLCVGTPQSEGGTSADLSQVHEAFRQAVAVLGDGELVVGKSTVPVGTAEDLDRRLRTARPDATLAWNPEFLREGHAVRDTLHPDRLVYGFADDRAAARGRPLLDEAYGGVAAGTPRIVTDLATAQLVKMAANSFLATKVSFINAMADLCEAAGGDVTVLARAIGLDERIGPRYLGAGAGFGGGCLPKDVRAFTARADELGAHGAAALLRVVDEINLARRDRLVALVRDACGGDLAGRAVAVLGAAFKPDSDDVRESPAMEVAARLQREGATVTVTDPRAVSRARDRWPALGYAATAEQACAGADAVLVVTEWPEYVGLDPAALARLVATPRVVDGRHCLPADAWRAAGWDYRAPGLG